MQEPDVVLCIDREAGGVSDLPLGRDLGPGGIDLEQRQAAGRGRLCGRLGAEKPSALRARGDDRCDENGSREFSNFKVSRFMATSPDFARCLELRVGITCCLHWRARGTPAALRDGSDFTWAQPRIGRFDLASRQPCINRVRHQPEFRGGISHENGWGRGPTRWNFERLNPDHIGAKTRMQPQPPPAAPSGTYTWWVLVFTATEWARPAVGIFWISLWVLASITPSAEPSPLPAEAV